MASEARRDSGEGPLLLRLAARLGRPGRYAFAAAVTTIALLLRLVLAGYVGPPYLLFLPAIVLASLVGGFGPSVLAIGLAAVYAAAFILPGERGAGQISTREITGLALFTLVSASLSYLAKRYVEGQLRLRDLAVEQVRLEGDAELQTNQRRLNLAARSGHIGLWDLDLRTDLAWRTLQHDQLFGYRELQPTWGVAQALQHVVPEDRPEFQRAFEEAFATGLFHYEVRISPADGPLRWIAADGEVLRDVGGRPVRMMGTVVDVTERKQAEKALKESQGRLELFIRHAPAAIAMLDRDLRYLAVSQRYLVDYRLAGQEVLGRSHYELFPEISERWREIHRRCLAGEVEKCDEDAFPRTDGRIDWVRWEIRPWRDGEGAVGGLLIFSEVITDQKESEARASRAERLAAVATLVRGLSHEVNNPLASVVTNIGFALEQVATAPAVAIEAWRTAGHAPLTELSSALADAASGADRIRVIVKDMHAFLPQDHVAQRHASPGEAMTAALELVEEELRPCASVTVDMPELPDVAVGRAELVQVLFSLLANAGQATGKAPNQVRIAGALAGPGRVTITIHDTGLGMTPSVMQHAMEPFFTTREVGQGKGLGLPLCRGVIDSAGGELTIASLPGQGTTVTVTLPVRDGLPPADAAG